jgi:hypothetical protein
MALGFIRQADEPHWSCRMNLAFRFGKAALVTLAFEPRILWPDGVVASHRRLR